VGVPRVVVSRESLGAPNIDAAIEAASMAGRAGGYAHILVSATDTVIVETSATTDHVLRDVRAHTNHYLTPEWSVAPRPSKGSASRLSRALRLLRDSPPHNLEECAAFLADHDGKPESICLHEDGRAASATVFGMVCDVATGRVIVSDGPPCGGRWEEFSLSSSEAAVVE
jgi:hypothetical protein